MLYIKRILLAFLLSGILLISGQTFIHFQTNNYYYDEFVYSVGILSEESPNEVEPVISRYITEEHTDALYKKGETALAKLGYGENGIDYIKHSNHITLWYYLMIITIIIILLFLAFYVISFLKRLKKVGKNMVFNMEHAMNQYPVTFNPPLSKIKPVNQVTHQIKVLVDQLNHQIQLMKLAQADRTVFIENISHQIKTPLTCISLDLELLSNLKDQEKINTYINSCYSQIDHIEALINRLLKIGKLESGKVHFEFFEHNLLDTIHVLCNRTEDKDSTKKVTLIYSKEDNYTIAYDYIWLSEALENIINNCYLYSNDNDGITITLTRYDSYIKIELSDHGIGIPPEDLPNIFDRFYRSKQTKNQEGFGIGLNLAKLVVEGHHGTIFAKSDNHSTQFIIHLPLLL